MASLLILASCATKQEKDDFDYTVESFADLEILRYKVPGFENLSLKQKEMIYYLSEADSLLYCASVADGTLIQAPEGVALTAIRRVGSELRYTTAEETEGTLSLQ